MAEREPTPIACTLDTGNMKTRMAWIANLNAAALKESRHEGLRLELTYDRAARDDVLQMVRNEQECCAFLTFTVREEPDTIRITIDAPEAARDAGDAVFAPFLSDESGPRSSGCGCCEGQS